MSKVPDSELPKIYKTRLIDAIKALALDYEVQLTLVPPIIHWALISEMIEEWDIFYTAVLNCPERIFDDSITSRLLNLDNMIQNVIDKKIKSLADLKNSKEWGDIRLLCRSLLNLMGEQINYPDSWKPR